MELVSGGNSHRRRPPARRIDESSTEWTLEHHKLFLDAAVGLGLNDFKNDATPAATRVLIVELMSKNSTRDTKKIRFLRPVLIHHMREFQRMQKKIDDSLSGDQMMRAFEGLNVNSDGNNNGGRMKEYFSPWTLELHKKLVEAVIQLGGLGKAIRPGGPYGILRLMDEESRRGLTEQMVKRRLWKLMDLQKKTRRATATLDRTHAVSNMVEISTDLVRRHYATKGCLLH